MRLSGVIFLLFVGLWGQAQNRYTISGEVLDAESQETLIGVTLLVPELNTGTVTNAYGFYSLTLPEGEYSLVVQYLGYKTQMLALSINQGSKLDIRLEIASETLEEVVVTDDIERINIKKPEMSINRLSASTIQQTPVVFGEPDVLKTIQLLPGVTSAGEGASGFNVRGGAADQNLILLDEASIYNSSHLFGFFSVFNPDAIKDIRLYKGGIPAKYGGRVSSVLDIYQKEGNKEDFKLNGGIGLVASRLLAEGPIGKGSFLVGGRGTYAHLFLKATDNPNSAYFYDLNTKISFPVNKNNKFFLSGYFGRDVFDVD
ncbi:MAG: TonB-dependent receptor, partial [Flavobacteriaceae bacterium]